MNSSAIQEPPVNEAQSPQPESRSKDIALPRSFVSALIGYAIFLIIGVLLGSVLQVSPSSQPGPGPSSNIFTYLFAFHEPVVCAVHLLCILIGFRWLQRGALIPAWLPNIRSDMPHLVPAMALTAVVVAALGTFVVFHGFSLSMDEYMADFQAKIFASGKVAAEVPEQWRPFVPWLKPIFSVYDQEAHTWTSPYLPVYGALRALPTLAGLEWLLNPVLAGISLLAIAGVARHLWPEQPSVGPLAAALLLSSTQFLITSMTAYSMPAHLCFNLVWLWLFTRPGANGKLLAPWLGILAVGLHQPNVHLLFALPFGIRFLRDRQWRWAAYYLAMYLLALFLWVKWWAIVRPGAVGDSASFFTWPNSTQLSIQTMNAVLVASWQSALLGVLTIFALRNWKSLPPIVQDMAFGCVITCGSYLLFNSDQGHGWGYRYFHAVLGNLVLLGVAGWSPLQRFLGETLAKRFALCSFAVSLLLLLPVRAVQTEAVVRPFALADSVFHNAKADTVLLPIFSAWYAQDLIRNGPFLDDSPKILRGIRLDQARFQLLQQRGSVWNVPPEALSKMGLVTDPLSSP